MTKVETTKEKWAITLDSIMIIGKYLMSNQDYINVMKVSKKYHDLTQMYHFNPMSDYSLFENMETQHFYSKQKEPKKQSFMSKLFGLFKSSNDDVKKAEAMAIVKVLTDSNPLY